MCKMISVPADIGDIVYINLPNIQTPARRVVTQLRVTIHGICVTVKNARTGEQETHADTAFGKTIFVDENAARAVNERWLELQRREENKHD